LNLHLRIGDRRPDGYHEIESLFAALAFGDTLYLETVPKPSILEICMNWQPPDGFSGGFSAGKTAIPPEKNIISRAVSLFRSRTGYEEGLKITVEKRIPLGGGLGGGSSNAAAALLALNHLASEGKGLLNNAELAEMGASLGSDVPFFVYLLPGYEKEKNLTTEDTEFHGGNRDWGLGTGDHCSQSQRERNTQCFQTKTLVPDPRSLVPIPSSPPCNSVPSVVKNSSFFHTAAWISGKGERVQPLELPESARNLSIVLVNPGFPSDTAEAYRLFDVWRGKNASLLPQDSASLLQSLSGSPQNWPFFNDFLTVFEAAAGESPSMSESFTAYQHIISGLREQGADFAGLSGSGSTCFGVFSGPEKAASARENLAPRWPFVISTFLLARSATPWYN